MTVAIGQPFSKIARVGLSRVLPRTTSAKTTSALRRLSSLSRQTSSFSKQATFNMSANQFSPVQIGALHTPEYKCYVENSAGQVVSPFHDIPLVADASKNTFNMVVEIPRWTNAKLEISKDQPFNPIVQDTKKGKLRFVRNCFPHKGYIWNYGCFPQTWEDPNSTHAETKAKGDNDPLDVCEIGEAVGYTGQVKQVKVLGIMALLDEGETDWKVLVIDVNDPLAAKLNDIEDVERHLPGLCRATNEWFRIYKIPDGKPENQFAFSGEAKNKKYAHEIVLECHEAWKRLIGGQTGSDVKIENVTCDSPAKTAAPAIPKDQAQPPAPIDASIDKSFFISPHA